MADTETKVADAAKKIKLKFTALHLHNGKQYHAGDSDNFTQADADLIRSQGTAVLADVAPPAPVGSVAGAPQK